MIFWILAIVLLASLGIIGFYQGAIRVGFSLIGLIAAAVLAVPAGVLVKPILKIFLDHPVALAFIAPAVAYLIILIAFKVGGVAVHRKLDTFYKYSESDTKRLLWERLNSRLGICLGVANATVYVFLIAFVVYVVGYFTKQVQTPNQTSIAHRWANLAADHLRESRMDKAVAFFMPDGALFYDAVDVIGLVFHQPLLQHRLATYPPFLSLENSGPILAVANDQGLQERWLGTMSFNEFIGNQSVNALMHDVDVYNQVLGLVENDLGDLEKHLRTGKSPKYENDAILGKWSFNYSASYNLARRKKALMSLAELRALRRALGALREATLTAYVDNSVKLLIPTQADQPPTTVKGTWRNEGGGRFQLKVSGAGMRLESAARVDQDRLYLTRDDVTLILEK
jgi:hypothetical protein